MKEPIFQYPSGCPDSVIKRLVKIAGDTAHQFGAEAGNDGIIITDQAIEYLVCAICAGLTVATHDALVRRESLLADKEVAAWLARFPRPLDER